MNILRCYEHGSKGMSKAEENQTHSRESAGTEQRCFFPDLPATLPVGISNTERTSQITELQEGHPGIENPLLSK